MDDGLTYDKVTAVTLGTGAWNAPANQTLIRRTDYTVSSQGPHHFAVELTEAGLAKLDAVTEASYLYVRFSTYVNQNAAIGPQTNKNTPSFTYATNRTDEMTINGNKPSLITYEIDLTKQVSLSSADVSKITFEVSLDGNVMTFTKEAAGVYHPVTPGETGGTTLVSPDSSGSLILRGLDSLTYVLTEKATDAGLTLLAAPVTFNLAAADPLSGALSSATVAYGDREPVGVDDSAALANGVVPWTIDNAAALLIPKTGGLGSGRYAALGGILLAAVTGMAVLAGKKRAGHGKRG